MKLRSMLFVPSDNERKLENARASIADALILDLEDAVAIGRKPIARQLAATYLSDTCGRRKWQGFVRINPLSSSEALLDLAAVVAPGLDGVVLPKADGAEDVIRLGAYLDALEIRAGMKIGTVRIVVVATETAKGMLNLHSYAQRIHRLVGLTWGAEDLSAILGAITNREQDGQYSHAYLMARSMSLFAAGAAETSAIDTLYANYRDGDGLASDCGESRRRGFVGRLAIHPDQVECINRCYTPSTEDVALAQTIVDAFTAAPDIGTIGIDGKMYDRPHLLQALKTLAAAEIGNT
ncbi:MAG: CoA ester lyase [Georgfuchsia sp.]